MSKPFNFNDGMCQSYFSMQPSSVKGRWNVATERYRRYLYNKLFSVYKFTIPKYWPLNFFRFWLFYYGSTAVCYTRDHGWIMGPYGITEQDMYYQPFRITMYNHFLSRVADGVIGINSGIIHMMDDYFSLDDMVTDYAETLAMIDKSIKINLMNSNVAVALPAKNAKDASDLKEAYGKATEGNPFVAINKDLLDSDTFKPIFKDLKSNYLVSDLLMDRVNVVNQFLTEIGISNTDYTKRAQMSREEVNRNDQEVRSLCSVILENIKESMERLNRISDLGLGVEFRFKETGGESNEQMPGRDKADAVRDI